MTQCTDWLIRPGESIAMVKKRREALARAEGWVYKPKPSEFRKELSMLKKFKSKKRTAK